VDYNLSQVPKSKIDGNIFLEGFKWSIPLKSSFCRNLKDVYDNYEIADEKAKKLKKRIITNFHKNTIQKKYNKILDKFGT
jgi:hypothetical protein